MIRGRRNLNGFIRRLGLWRRLFDEKYNQELALKNKALEEVLRILARTVIELEELRAANRILKGA
jgi:hypothetical protein